MLVLTVGDGVAMFTLDREMGSWVLTQENVQIPAETKEFAINMSNQRHWAPPVTRYIDECLQGKDGPRGKDFNMRWVASMVADVHRILTRGGIFMYPWDKREPEKAGKLRLLYEANPMSFLVEQAGGAATNGRSASWTCCRQAARARGGVPRLEERGRAARRRYHQEGFRHRPGRRQSRIGRRATRPSSRAHSAADAGRHRRPQLVGALAAGREQGLDRTRARLFEQTDGERLELAPQRASARQIAPGERAVERHEQVGAHMRARGDRAGAAEAARGEPLVVVAAQHLQPAVGDQRLGLLDAAAAVLQRDDARMRASASSVSSSRRTPVRAGMS